MLECALPLLSLRQDAVTVVSCGDENFIAPTGVLMRSIMDHAAAERFYDLIFLHNGVQTSLLHQLCSLAEGQQNVSIRCCDIESAKTQEGLHTLGQLPEAALTGYTCTGWYDAERQSGHC